MRESTRGLHRKPKVYGGIVCYENRPGVRFSCRRLQLSIKFDTADVASVRCIDRFHLLLIVDPGTLLPCLPYRLPAFFCCGSSRRFNTFKAFLLLCARRIFAWNTKSSRRRCSRWRLAFLFADADGLEPQGAELAAVASPAGCPPTPSSSLTCSTGIAVGCHREV